MPSRASVNVTVPVAVMLVRIVGVGVGQNLMGMRVAVGFADRIIRPMTVLVVGIVNVPVFVFQSFVGVFVFMTLGEVQPDPDRHQKARQDKRRGDWFGKQDQRNGGTHEGGG